MTNEQKLREALKKYGQHIGDCWGRAWSTPCFCGLDEIVHPSPQPPTSDEGTPVEISALKATAKVLQVKGDEYTASLLNQAADTLHAKERELANKDNLVASKDRVIDVGQEIINGLRKQLAALPSVSAAPQEGKADYVRPTVVPGLVHKAKQLRAIAHAAYHLLEGSEEDAQSGQFNNDEPKDWHALNGTLNQFSADEDIHDALREFDSLLETYEAAPPPATPRGDGGEAEAFERVIVAPLRGRYDEKQRTADFAMFSLGYHAAPQSGKKEEWISVSERLPEEKDEDENVIVHWKDGLMAVLLDHQVKDDRFELTHWMPLPSPPASKAEGEK